MKQWSEQLRRRRPSSRQCRGHCHTPLSYWQLCPPANGHGVGAKARCTFGAASGGSAAAPCAGMQTAISRCSQGRAMQRRQKRTTKHHAGPGARTHIVLMAARRATATHDDDDETFSSNACVRHVLPCGWKGPAAEQHQPSSWGCNGQPASLLACGVCCSAPAPPSALATGPHHTPGRGLRPRAMRAHRRV